MKFNVSLTALCVSLLTCVAGCKRDQGDTLNFRLNKDGKGTPVASFNGDSITVETGDRRSFAVLVVAEIEGIPLIALTPGDARQQADAEGGERNVEFHVKDSC